MTRRRQIKTVKEIGNATVTHVSPVHVPPRGVWGQRGPVALITAEAWLGQSVAPNCVPDEAILRYLAAFAPPPSPTRGRGRA